MRPTASRLTSTACSRATDGDERLHMAAPTIAPPVSVSVVRGRRRRRRRRAVSAVTLALVVAMAWQFWSRTRVGTVSQLVTARPAAEFVDSIGVNTHLHYTDTPYDRFDDVVRPRLHELGIRHIRDAAYTYDGVSQDTTYYQRLRVLGGDGIALNLLTSIQTDRFERTDVALLDDIQRWTDGAVEAIEGANEPDLSGVDDWVARTRSLQRDLWRAVRSRPTLSTVDVVAPSPAWEPEALGDVSRWTDLGNWHPYPGGRCPSCATDDAGFNAQLERYGRPAGSQPMVVTETGYHNAVAGDQSHPPVSERAAARYLPRLLFEHFNAGIRRTYLYELIDQRDDPSRTDREANFGLLRNDGSRKPAYIALRNLVTILDDPGGPSTPQPLPMAIEGHGSDVGHSLLQKSSGVYELVLWRRVSSYRTDEDGQAERRDVEVRPARVVIRTDGPSASVRIFDPLRAAAPTREARRVSRLSVDLTDRLVVVEIRR